MGTVARNRQHNQTTQQHSDPSQLVSSAGRAAELGAAASGTETWAWPGELLQLYCTTLCWMALPSDTSFVGALTGSLRHGTLTGAAACRAPTPSSRSRGRASLWPSLPRAAPRGSVRLLVAAERPGGRDTCPELPRTATALPGEWDDCTDLLLAAWSPAFR